MKIGEEIKDTLIDKFYHEGSDDKLLESITDEEAQKEMMKFGGKLEDAKEKMDSLLYIDYSMDISIMDIINEAEEINNKKKNKWETVLFLLLSTAIFSILGLLTLGLGTKFIIYFQLAIVMLTPFMLIPICKAVLTKGGKSV